MDCKYNEKYFKRHYATPFYRCYLDFRNKFIRNEVNKIVSSGKFLEIGFGDDNLIKFFKNEFDVFGIDISEFAVKQIQESYNPANFRVGDISKEKIPFEEKFDVICAINVLEHLENPKFALENVFNSLKAGEVFAIYLPTQSNILSRIQYQILYDFKEHIFRPSIKSLRKLLKETGFTPHHFSCFPNTGLKMNPFYFSAENGAGFTLLKEYAASFFPLKISNNFILESTNLYFSLWKK